MFGSLWLILLNNLKIIRCFFFVKKKEEKELKFMLFIKKK